MQPAITTSRNTVKANQVVARLANLAHVEEGFVIREVARLNTRRQLNGTWFQRSGQQPICFDHGLWRFRLREADSTTGKAVFGIMMSSVTNYLINLFSTNNNVAKSQLERIPIPDSSRLDLAGLARIINDLLGFRSELEQRRLDFDGTLPDIADTISVSPASVLRSARLPSVNLESLRLRGDLNFIGAEGSRLARVYPRRLSVSPDSPLAAVLPIFVAAYGAMRWHEAARVVELPEPSVADRWLAEYERVLRELQDAWGRFERLQRDLDTAVCDWYGFNQEQRAAIARGLPWTHA